MCLIGFAWKADPDFPLVVAANRDEYHVREAAASTWWESAPDLLAGRDLQSGGTWMGITRSGRFAALTNFRDIRAPDPDAPSRGGLVTDYLVSSSPPVEHLARLHSSSARFNGFNLLAGTMEQLGYTGNRGAAPQELSPGIYGLSNALLDTPWPKVVALKSALATTLGKARSEEALPSTISTLAPRLFEALANTRPSADAGLPDTGLTHERERMLSSAMIRSPSYGTRASTLLWVCRTGDVFWEERSFSPAGGILGVVQESFSLS